MTAMRRWERPLDLLEAAYRQDGSDDEWLRGLVKTTANVFAGDGLGAAAFFAFGRVDEVGRTVLADTRTYCGLGRAVQARNGSAFLRTLPKLPPDLQQSFFFSPETAGTISVATGLGDALQTSVFWRDGGWDPLVTADSLGLKCHEDSLHVLVLGVALRRVMALKPIEQRLWQRVATHVGAASRLRRSRSASSTDAEAVFSPTGKVKHLARGIDGSAVREGFARRRYARSRGTPPQAALE